MWGTATASFQIEGGADVDRTPSIWDEFCETSGNVANGDTGKVACDHYHRFREDVQLMKSLGTRYYRFSIAWPRIQKWDEDNNASPNAPGIEFYNQLINELLQNEITPVPTLYHWDLPLPVQARTGGWSGDREITDLFSEYARLCFREFGDRVEMWITLNEPWCSAVLGCEVGEHAPGVCPKTGKQTQPGVDVYLAGHNLLLAHAKAVDVYRSEFKEIQGGSIGVTLNSRWIEPKDKNDPECMISAQRSLDFELGWFADPVYFGDYPESMRRTVGSRLPAFTSEEKKLLKGSSEFFGLNHYSSTYSTGLKHVDGGDQSATYGGDIGVKEEAESNWQRTDMGWSIVPWGFRNLLIYIQKRYSPPGGIVVTENGLASKESTVEEMQNDKLRIEYFNVYISAMQEAMNAEEAADVRGYFAWSLMDNFEWAFGYEKRFGLYYVNYETLERLPKPVVKWYRTLVTSNMLPVVH
ncbi:beta-glucosidase family GH1 [Gracilaria domingensis]|nr:beta-glucosidase family GH1 [Gracilaria domingensis]